MTQDSPAKNSGTPVPNPTSRVPNSVIKVNPNGGNNSVGDAENSVTKYSESRLRGLRQHAFRPGQSGNPSGRPRRLPITEAYVDWLHKRIPAKLRLELQTETGMKLPKKMTFREAIALKRVYAAVSDMESLREVRGATENTAIVIQPEDQHGNLEDVTKEIYAHLINVSYGRGKLYNMPMPELDQMAKDAGVDLEEAMGDKKPSSTESPIGVKKP